MGRAGPVGERTGEEALLVPIDRTLDQVVEFFPDVLGDVLIQMTAVHPRCELLLFL